MEDSDKIPPHKTSTKDFDGLLMEASSSKKIQPLNHQTSMESKDSGDGSHLKPVILNNLIRHLHICLRSNYYLVTLCCNFFLFQDNAMDEEASKKNVSQDMSQVNIHSDSNIYNVAFLLW